MTDTAEHEPKKTGAAAPPPPGWDGILDPGEHILWQGRPDQGFHLNPTRLAPAVFGLFFAGFAVFWMVMASRAGGVFWMFGLIHFAVGIGLSANGLAGDTFRRRATWYTLSNKRAFVATDQPWKTRQLKSYPITPGTVLDYRAGTPATIYFAHETRRGNKGRSYNVDIGFERIDGGETVLGHLRRVQQGAGGGEGQS